MYSAASSCGIVELLGQAVRAEAVDDAEVDRLRARALARADLLRRELQDLGRGRGVHVLAALEDLLQHVLAGDVGEDPQLDLRVVGRDQRGALLGDEAAADLAPELRADRDVLEVRVGARQAARSWSRSG